MEKSPFQTFKRRLCRTPQDLSWRHEQEPQRTLWVSDLPGTKKCISNCNAL